MGLVSETCLRDRRRGQSDRDTGSGELMSEKRENKSGEESRGAELRDPVTGLAAGTLFEERTNQALKHAQRKRLAFCVAMFHIDRFDTLVSSLGDDGVGALLEQFGRRLGHAGRAEDTIAYLGNGGFAALLPGAAGPAEAATAVNSILGAAGEPLAVGPRELLLTMSMGVAVYPSDGVTAEELLGNALAAMRLASDGGGDSWRFFHPSMNAERHPPAGSRRRAPPGVRRRPVLPGVPAGRVRRHRGDHRRGGAARWRHPERGVVEPLDFIPAAEDSGLLIALGARVLEEACRQGRAWQRQLGRPLLMSVNISARELHDERLVDTVRRVLRATGFDPHALELEITEIAAMRDAHHTAQVLGALRAMRVRVAIDDFGTGYSSLSHLVRLAISTVKIDRSFVRDLKSVPEHAAVAAAVIALGHRLGLTVVAEGVESLGERDALRDEGCDAIQGFLYSKPLAADECGELLAAGTIRR